MRAWIQFYYLSTGAWHQSSDVVRMQAPLLATFLIPLIIGALVIGFHHWRSVVSSLVAAIITGWLPVATIAGQLLPNSYINLAIVLILLMMLLCAFEYYRDYHVRKLQGVRYTQGLLQ